MVYGSMQMREKSGDGCLEKINPVFSEAWINRRVDGEFWKFTLKTKRPALAGRFRIEPDVVSRNRLLVAHPLAGDA